MQLPVIENIKSLDKAMLRERVGFWIDVEAVRCDPEGFQSWYRIRTGDSSLFELAVEQTLEGRYSSEKLATSAALAAAEKVIEEQLTEYVQKLSPDGASASASNTEVS